MRLCLCLTCCSRRSLLRALYSQWAQGNRFSTPHSWRRCLLRVVRYWYRFEHRGQQKGFSIEACWPAAELTMTLPLRNAKAIKCEILPAGSRINIELRSFSRLLMMANHIPSQHYQWVFCNDFEKNVVVHNCSLVIFTHVQWIIRCIFWPCFYWRITSNK